MAGELFRVGGPNPIILRLEGLGGEGRGERVKGGSNNGFSKTHGPQAPFVNLSCNDTLFGRFLSVFAFFIFFYLRRGWGIKLQGKKKGKPGGSY